MEWLTTAQMFLHMQAHGLFNNDLSPSPWHELGSVLLSWSTNKFTSPIQPQLVESVFKQP